MWNWMIQFDDTTNLEPFPKEANHRISFMSICLKKMELDSSSVKSVKPTRCAAVRPIELNLSSIWKRLAHILSPILFRSPLQNSQSLLYTLRSFDVKGGSEGR